MIFRRKSEAKTIWQGFNDELSRLNEELKMKLHFPKNNRNLLWNELVFNEAIYIYVESLNCYNHHLYEACTIMCRNSIDSAIFLAWEHIRTKDLTTYKIREPKLIKQFEKMDLEVAKENGIRPRLV